MWKLLSAVYVQDDYSPELILEPWPNTKVSDSL